MRIGALVSLPSLAVGLLSVNFVSCSLESNDLVQSALSKRTFVRANPRASARATPIKERRAAQIAEVRAIAQRATVAAQRTGFRPPARPTAQPPVMKLASKAKYQGYAAAYSRPVAMVQDSSIIPFAIQPQPKQSILKRLTLPILNKFKRPVETAEQRLERLALAQPSIRVRTTAYTHNEADHLKYGRKTALGTRLRYGKVRSAAADWSRYPVGTQFRIKDQPGILYEVDDYGGALVGTGTVDLYKPTFSAMNRWGVRHVDIEVIKWGSFAKSLHILKPRTKYSHIRRMVNSIQKKGANEEARLTALLMVHGTRESQS